MAYEAQAIEKKWQDRWEADGVFHVHNDDPGDKFYLLVEFPYPSGDGLHVGHPRSYTALDTVARKRRLQGDKVLYPMGWDAFGLPTENYAIAHKIHPAQVTEQNVARFKQQLRSLGYSFDWSREVNTTDPEYYKWTQWIFLKLLENDLAYKSEMAVNWCPSCLCVLANEEVVGGACERCGAVVERRVKEQWMLKITAYADKLLEGLNKVNYPERVKASQRHWIGRSEGATVKFGTSEGDDLEIYTTRPDTLYGVTYMVLSPEHPYLKKWQGNIKNWEEIAAYQSAASHKSDFERSEINKDKTGVRIQGVKAVHPVSGEELPIFVADYVLMSYGTGAIMAVPAHDERDYDFAKAHDLPMIPVISGSDLSQGAHTDTEHGTIINSDLINGLSVKDAIEKMTSYLESTGQGARSVNYRLRDWVFSRQRYWGEPIPVVHCETCGIVPVPVEDLPVVLPQVESYEPNENGESPLADVDEWVNTTCPSCGAHAKRETDTMPQWAGSSWYFLRYTDPHNDEAFASPEALKTWLPVNWYNGGMEHTTLHLLYSRFWNHFLYDLGLVPVAEPYQMRTSHGMILGEDGQKMSKSRGNVVNPDDIVKQFGADTLRLYELFIGDYEKAAPWNTNGVSGCRRFLERTWTLKDRIDPSLEVGVDGYQPALQTLIHQSIKKVGEDLENLKGNTAVAQLMTLLNAFMDHDANSPQEVKTFLTLLYPMAPHISEELAEILGYDKPMHAQTWPSYDESKLVEDVIEIALQINGKVRSRLEINKDATKDEVLALAKRDERVIEALTDGTLRKEIYVPGRLVNLVIN